MTENKKIMKKKKNYPWAIHLAVVVELAHFREPKSYADEN